MRVSVRISAKKDLSGHVLIVGRTGSGKSVLSKQLIYSLVLQSNENRKHAVMVIDPHGDLARDCLFFAINNRNSNRLIYLSSAINREADTGDSVYSCVFNPFVSDGSSEMIFLLTETLTECLCELLTDATLTTQMISVIRPCIATVLRSPDPSLATLNRFFLEGYNADLIELGKTSDVEQHRIFFSKEWNAEHLRVSKNSIRVKLSYFLSDQRLANMLNGKPTVNIEQALNDGAFIILNLPKGSGSFTSKVMGKLMIAYIHALMLRRDALEPSERVPCYLIVDEFGSIVTASLSSSLAEARKYGLSCILANQSLMQIENTAIRKTIAVNTGLKVVGLTDYQDRVTFSRELGKEVSAEDLEKLRPLQFYLKRNDGRHKAFKFNASILPRTFFLTKKEKKDLLKWIVYESGQYRLVMPPAPPIPTMNETVNTVKGKKKQPLNSSTNEGLKPKF